MIVVGAKVDLTMDVKRSSLILLAVYLCINFCIYGVKGRSLTEEEEDMELERHLKIINKPPLKTIQTEYGDVIDCIDINKQPAFDNPLLKNHKIQMRPTFLLEETQSEASSIVELARIGLKSKGCPDGSVPIRRTRKEELKAAKAISKSYSDNFHPQTSDNPGYHFAQIYTDEISGVFYHGGKANINLYNPKVEGKGRSTAQIWLESGPPDTLNKLEVGWGVIPDVYGDTRTRLFTYWTGDASRKTGCFNIFCPGFVQTSKEVTLGEAFDTVSTIDGQQYEIMVYIHQDPTTKNWWFIFTDYNIAVGYWPNSIFTHLQGGASKVLWGGSVSAPPNTPSPPMGSGRFPDGNYHHACWFRQVLVVNRKDELIGPLEKNVKTFADTPNCYDVKYYGDMLNKMGQTFLFGGPGGNCGS